MPSDREPTAAHDATPLTTEEMRGLLLPVRTPAELDGLEAEGIAAARLRVLGGRRVPIERVLTERWFRALHRQMFHQVWAWAGTYRTTERNLGVPAWRIATDVATLLDDASFWISAGDAAAMPTDEICLRLSHRAVAIHPFPNGNGRWSRLLANTAAVSLGRPPFSWGRSPLRSHDEIRGAYLAALRTADRTLDYGPLISFARESSGR